MPCHEYNLRQNYWKMKISFMHLCEMQPNTILVSKILYFEKVCVTTAHSSAHAHQGKRSASLRQLKRMEPKYRGASI
jgi:hypothetical protein